MKLILKLLFVLLLTSQVVKATTISGTVTNNSAALSNGSVTMQLFGCASPLVNSSAGPAAKTLYSFTLDVNGNLPTAAVTGNDVIYCSGIVGTTYYELKAYNSANGLIWDRYYRITGFLWNINSASVLTNFGISTYLLVNPSGDQVVTTPLTNRLTFAGGPTLIQQLQVGRDPINLNDAATKNYVDNIIGSVNSTVASVVGKVNRSGDTMTGPLILSGDPLSALQATTKEYVDAQVAGASSSINVITCSTNIVILPGTSNYLPLGCPVGTSTLASGSGAASTKLTIKQTGGYVFNWPSNVHGTFTVGLIAGSYTNIELRWDATDNIWLVYSALIN